MAVIFHRGAARFIAALALTSTALSQSSWAGEFASAISLSSFDGTTGFRLNGVDVLDMSGRSVASAGDVNGDGFGDVIIGATGADPPGGSTAGESYVVFGKGSSFNSAIDLSSLDGTTGFRLNGIGATDYSGYSVASAGDVNGDGFSDIVIGALSANGGVGQSYVVFGKASGFASAIDLSGLDGTTGFRLDGAAAGDQSGVSVASADVNGDGLSDILVGAYRADQGAYGNAGTTYVVFGTTAGFASAIGLSGLNGSTGFRLNGIAAYDNSGRSVASAGDVNGDGVADILVGANEAPDGVSKAGQSYVVFGTKTGFASAIDLSALDGSTGFRLDGVAADDKSGQRVASAGDVNGDGFADIVIGANYASPGGDSYAGQSYVVFGKAAGGFASAIDLSGLDGTTGFRLDGIDAGDYSGFSVASAGDMNGDGFVDIAIGAFWADPNTANRAGESYVIFGGASGFASAIDLASLNGTTGFRLEGSAAYDNAGISVASARDVNGDGFGDLIVGARGPNVYTGASYVMFGRAPDGPVTRVGSAAAQYINGGAFADNLSGLGGNDRLEGRGGADALDGGLGKDTADYSHAASGVIANLAAPGGNTGNAAGDTYISIEHLTGSAFADTLTGNGGANRIAGGKGADTLIGGGGADILAGGAGKDIQTGGSGADVFLYSKRTETVVGANRDQIGDFNAGAAGTSVDKIDLRPIDARTNVAGNQAFSFIGTGAFTGTSGQLRIALSGSTTIVSGDVNGDMTADFQIGLLNFTNLANLTGIDFLK